MSVPVEMIITEGLHPLQRVPHLTSLTRFIENCQAQGKRVELIAPSDNEEEFIHWDGALGVLVHRIAPSRGYAAKLPRMVFPRFSKTRSAYALRAREKIWELEHLWNRHCHVTPWPSESVAEASSLSPVAHRKAAKAERVDVDVIVCTYRRFEPLLTTLDSLLPQIQARTSGLTRLTLVYQEADLPDCLFAQRPELRQTPQLSWIMSTPPSLTRARNQGLANTSGDLVIFVDDDVRVDPHFLDAYLDAAESCPQAIGIAGGIHVPGIERRKIRAVGQIRASGYVQASFESLETDLVLVPQTPMGANMAYRREAMNALFGTRWFDESLTGSAFREETTLALDIFRRGHHFVFAPRASLLHYEATSGGCENRVERTPPQLLAQTKLELRFLERLYGQNGWWGNLAPLATGLREIRQARSSKWSTAQAWARALLQSKVSHANLSR